MQILVVNTSLDWASRNPQFEDRRVTRLFVDHGHQAHDVPIPLVGPAGDAALSLGLQPYATYGDVFLGLGHRAAFAAHRRKIVVVDDEINDVIGGLDRSDHGRLSAALESCDEIVATTHDAAARVAGHTSVQPRVVVDVRELLAIVDGPR